MLFALLSIKGRILNIQHFCTSDGPGIRTTVFLKGCPLHCAWCHNPETHRIQNDLFFHLQKCCACGACLSVCPQGAHQITKNGTHCLDRSICLQCGKCADACRTGALEIAGKTVTVREVLEELLSDRIFYENSGGGITLSGGEPTAQPDFTEGLLCACCNAGLHTALETAGICAKETLLRLLPYTDLFLLDWKLYDDALHKKYTGVSNRTVTDTLQILNEYNKSVHLRCPLIPGINTTREHYQSIVSLANEYVCIKQITLEPYHPLGIEKSKALGKAPLYKNNAFMDKSIADEAFTCVKETLSIPVVLASQ